jgi:Na+/citrate or Na+/malate symporter
MNKEKSFVLFNLPPIFFAIFSAIILIATYLGVLPEGMAGCFAFMIVVGTILYEIGERTPPIRAYLGGGAIVVLFGVALLNYFNLLPAAVKLADGTTAYNMKAHLDLVGNIRKFFRPTGAFLDFYIAALITGSILGMNRKLLVKAAARYFPAIIGAVAVSFTLTTIVGTLMGFGTAKSLLLIALPIMGGGMGAGAVPLSKIFEGAGTMSASEAISIMTPAVAIGNAISIVLAGILSKALKGKLNGNGMLMQSGVADPKELEISPEMQKKRDNISVQKMGIGLLVSCSFFAFGYIVAKCWDTIVPSVSIHAYAWMIITVAVCKITNALPEDIEIACYQWFQFIMKNLTTTLLFGIGLCYLDLNTVISSFSLTYLILCLVASGGAFLGAALIGNFVGFYPLEAGITAGLCMANMGGTGDVAVLSAADRMELMPFAQISSRLGGAIILVIGSLMLSVMGGLL